jgi:hypothetical protein
MKATTQSKSNSNSPPNRRLEYEQKQEDTKNKVNEIFSGKRYLVAKYNDDKIIIEKRGELYTFSYDDYVKNGNKIMKYDFTRQQGFLELFDEGTIKILDTQVYK